MDDNFRSCQIKENSRSTSLDFISLYILVGPPALRVNRHDVQHANIRFKTENGDTLSTEAALWQVFSSSLKRGYSKRKQNTVDHFSECI